MRARRERAVTATAAPMPHLAFWQRKLAAPRVAAEAAEFAARVQVRYGELLAQRPLVDRRVARQFLDHNVLPCLALYQTRREEGAGQATALAEVENLLWASFAHPPRLMMSILRLLPGSVLFALFRRLTRLDMRLRFPSPWWQTDVVADSDRGLVLRGRRCFVLDTLTTYGAPELTIVFCHLDDRLGEMLPPSLRWQRAGTLATGLDHCDFRWERVG